MPAADLLWNHYRETADPATRAELLGQHIGLVHHVVRQIAARVGDAVTYEDLVGAGMVGLVVAFEAFDPQRAVAFTTYATQRIRGAVLDELRAADPRTRLVRTRARDIQAAERALARELDRPPRPEEVAERLGIDIESYWEWRQGTETPVHVALDAPTGPSDRAPVLADIIPAAGPAPDAGLLAEEQLARVKDAIALLPEQQRTVLALCYYEELTLRQIAEVLHVTESRISQVRTAALKALRTQLQDDASA